MSASRGQWTATIDGDAVQSLATFVGPPCWLLVSYLVTQMIRDGCAQTVVKTKPAPGTFGGAALAVPAYRSTLVSGIPAFVAGLGGAADDWYDGENDTDDQGYPYQRIVHEQARTARPLEVGFAGLASAIVDYATASPADRPTVQYSYGPNETDDVSWLDLPAGDCQLRGRSSPSKVIQTSVSDATKCRLAWSIRIRYPRRLATLLG